MTPECAFLDAELIAMHALSIDNLAAAICCQLVLLALLVSDEQLVALHIGRSLRDAVPVVGCLSGDAVLPYHFVLFEIDM